MTHRSILHPMRGYPWLSKPIHCSTGSQREPSPAVLCFITALTRQPSPSQGGLQGFHISSSNHNQKEAVCIHPLPLPQGPQPAWILPSPSTQQPPSVRCPPFPSWERPQQRGPKALASLPASLLLPPSFPAAPGFLSADTAPQDAAAHSLPPPPQPGRDGRRLGWGAPGWSTHGGHHIGPSGATSTLIPSERAEPSQDMWVQSFYLSLGVRIPAQSSPLSFRPHRGVAPQQPPLLFQEVRTCHVAIRSHPSGPCVSIGVTLSSK